VAEGTLFIVSEKQKKKHVLFLFSDILMVTSPVKNMLGSRVGSISRRMLPSLPATFTLGPTSFTLGEHDKLKFKVSVSRSSFSRDLSNMR
jgi:hypothetical protein